MQRQFVPLDAKAVRQGGSVWNRDRADIQVVDGFAASAAEMAVMIEVGVLLIVSGPDAALITSSITAR